MACLEDIAEAIHIAGRHKQSVEEIICHPTQYSEIQWVIVFICSVNHRFVANAAFGVFDVAEAVAWLHSEVDAEALDDVDLRHDSSAEVAHLQVSRVIINLLIVVGEVVCSDFSLHLIAKLVEQQLKLKSEHVVGLILKQSTNSEAAISRHFGICDRQIRHIVAFSRRPRGVDLAVVIIKLAAYVHHVDAAAGIHSIMNFLSQYADTQ